ncbi:MAG: hypothetical protein K2X11_14030, partial [Acetobacteraceae bacterium]|nr:hypothetical protein [Acetobacteraceae bacterium]
ARAQLEQAQRARDVASAELAALAQRHATLRAEMRAAEAGVFVSDVGTDRSASQQAADRLRLLGAELSAALSEREARVAALRERLEAEGERLARLSGAAVPLPGRARLVSLAAGPGEEVRAGQEIARLADCGRPMAEAEVDERLFRSLAVGMAAEFVPADGGPALPGRVARLSSPAGGDPVHGLDVTRHRVAVSLEAPGCATSGAGRLRFRA